MDKNGTDPKLSDELIKFRKKYSAWWRPTSNMLGTLNKLANTDVHWEFRHGDLKNYLSKIFI